jgi:ParB family chromosome partitioning protein
MSTTPPKKLTGLGRGLGALIPQRAPASSSDAGSAEGSSVTVATETRHERVESGPMQVPISAIMPNPDQPRVQFKHAELEDLMNSIKEHGIIQPLTVSMRPGGGYELIAGERRFRASKMLGLTHVPVTVRIADSTQKLVLALIENIQREDLNPLEEARAYARLISEFDMTQEMVSKQVGKARSTVANTVRLLDLPREIQDAIAAGIVPAGSARAMLALPDTHEQLKFFKKLVTGKMSSREAEAGVRKAGGNSRKDPSLLAAEEELRGAFGTKVEIKNRKGKGSIIISFYSDEEFGGVMKKLRK